MWIIPVEDRYLVGSSAIALLKDTYFMLSDRFSRLDSLLSREIYFVNETHNFQFLNNYFCVFCGKKKSITSCAAVMDQMLDAGFWILDFKRKLSLFFQHPVSSILPIVAKMIVFTMLSFLVPGCPG